MGKTHMRRVRVALTSMSVENPFVLLGCCVVEIFYFDEGEYSKLVVMNTCSKKLTDIDESTFVPTGNASQDLRCISRWPLM